MQAAATALTAQNESLQAQMETQIGALLRRLDQPAVVQQLTAGAGSQAGSECGDGQGAGEVWWGRGGGSVGSDARPILVIMGWGGESWMRNQ